jgi:hypothetical protein
MEVKNIYLIIKSIVIIIFILYLFPNKNSKLYGKPIWHKPKKIIDFKLDGKGTSQQLIDIYSLSHISHGIIFYFILQKINTRLISKFTIALLVELAWEIFENTPYVINKYRENEEYKDYHGDSIINIIGDIIFMSLGYYLAFMNKDISIYYLIISEIILYFFNANLLHLSFGSLL